MTDLSRVANFRTKMEAETAASILEGAGIRVLIQSQEGWTQSPMAPGATLLVAQPELARAQELLEGFLPTDDD